MRIVQTLLFSLFVLIGAGSAWSQKFKKPDCTCQNYGRFIKAGQTACIRTNKGPKMARCVMRGNVTDWDFLDEKCAFTSMTTLPDQTRQSNGFTSVAN